MGGLFVRQKVATERAKYLDLFFIPRSNLYKSNIEGPCHMPRTSPPRPAAPRTAKLCWATLSCGIRVRPRTRHVPHGSCGPWKHLLARSGFVELVPVVVHFPQLTWLLAFSGSP